MQDRIAERFQQMALPGDFCSLRLVQERSEALSVRQNVLQPARASEDIGAMLTVLSGGGMGYAATSDLSVSGLQRAAEQAHDWALQSAGRSVVDFAKLPQEPPSGAYASREDIPWRSVPLGDKIDLLQTECARLKIDDRIVDWNAALWFTDVESLYLTSEGGQVQQRFAYLIPMMSATANAGSETQSRSFGARGYARQGGLEILDQLGYRQARAAHRLRGHRAAHRAQLPLRRHGFGVGS